MSTGIKHYASLLGLARRFRDGTKPLAEATNPTLRKEIISGIPKDPGERPPPAPAHEPVPTR